MTADRAVSGPIALVCLPYAGGSTTAFLAWKKWLDPRIELRPIELAGRRNRSADPLYADMDEAVDDVFARVVSVIDGRAYAVFGHSMGTILAYELIRRLIGAGYDEPVHAFFSGRFPPYVETERTELHTLGDDEFIQALSRFGSATDELFSNKEAVAFILPLLRHDYRLVETYVHHRPKLALACNITVMLGRKDTIVPVADVRRWCECTSGTCTFREFDAGHFFINSHRQEVVSIVNEALVRHDP